MDYFQNLTEAFLSKVTPVLKFSWRFVQHFQRYKSKCEKCHISECWGVLQKFLDGSWSEWLPKFNKFFPVQKCICGNIFFRKFVQSSTRIVRFCWNLMYLINVIAAENNWRLAGLAAATSGNAALIATFVVVTAVVFHLNETLCV